MRRLGDAVGLDNSSLYRHFASKTELANAVLDRVAGDFLAGSDPYRSSRPVTLERSKPCAVAGPISSTARPQHG